MTTVSNSQIVETLKDSLRELELERDTALVRYRVRIASIEQAISALEDEDGTFAKSALVELGPLDQAPPTDLAIGEDKLEAIRQYMRTHGRVRQADIGPALGFNSGTVSVGTRRLASDGEVTPLRKQQGSRVWEWVQVAEPVPVSAVAAS